MVRKIKQAYVPNMKPKVYRGFDMPKIEYTLEKQAPIVLSTLIHCHIYPDAFT